MIIQAKFEAPTKLNSSIESPHENQKPSLNSSSILIFQPPFTVTNDDILSDLDRTFVESRLDPSTLAQLEVDPFHLDWAFWWSYVIQDPQLSHILTVSVELCAARQWKSSKKSSKWNPARSTFENKFIYRTPTSSTRPSPFRLRQPLCRLSQALRRTSDSVFSIFLAYLHSKFSRTNQLQVHWNEYWRLPQRISVSITISTAAIAKLKHNQVSN